jgi:hypothetical protein
VANKNRRYRVVAVSLPTSEVVEADRLTEMLLRAGWPKANRSLVVREALLRLLEDLAGKEPEEVFRDFLDRYAKRAVGVVKRSS